MHIYLELKRPHTRQKMENAQRTNETLGAAASNRQIKRLPSPLATASQNAHPKTMDDKLYFFLD